MQSSPSSRISFLGLTILAVVALRADAAETWKVVIHGQAVGTADKSMLLFGEVLDTAGTQVGSYFERFTPTQVDPKTGAPLAGDGKATMRLDGGTIATEYKARVTGPGPKPNTITIETEGRIVNATGKLSGLLGTFKAKGVATQTFEFRTTVTYATSGAVAPIAEVQPVRHCTYHIVPASCCRPTYSCCRVPACEPRRFCPPACARPIRCRD